RPELAHARCPKRNSVPLRASLLVWRAIRHPSVGNTPCWAGGNVGMQSVLSSVPDGYTIAFVGPNYGINPTLYEKLPFNFIRDSAPVDGLIRLANVMVVHPAVPANNVAEFIAYAKANPGKINFASGGVGTSPHLSGELLKIMTGINLVHVP